MAVPLDQQFKIQKKGILEERLPVLHLSGMEQHYFVTYIPLPTDSNDTSAIEQWSERMTFISEDLTWLLQQDHTQFWCEVAFNKDFHALFDSYLRYAPRPQRSIATRSYLFIPNGKQSEEDVSRLMFMCILRLSTHKESTEHFFTPQGFGNVIYDNYIFDIPRLFDICSLYAINNKELLSKMIGNIFKQQPKYSDDLIIAIESIKDVIQDMARTFQTRTGPKKLQSSSKSSDIGEVIDLLYYILDLSSTVNRLFVAYPQGRMIFFNQHFHITLVNLFEIFLRVYGRARQSNEIVEDIELFEETKYETVMLFHELLSSCCIDPLVANENKSEYVESMLNICSLLITEKQCLAAYEDYFNLCELFDLVHETTGLLDEQQMKFYKGGVQQAIELHGTPSCRRKLTSTKTSPSKASASGHSQTNKSNNPNIQMIQDLFPDLNQNYIEICLKHYENNAERVVNALFDNTVPEHLQIETQKESSTTTLWTETNDDDDERVYLENGLSLVDQRVNIYDDDQFGVFNQENVELGRIYRGKKKRDDPKDLDDKSHLEGMDERYARLGLVEDISDGEYDDEYDDTYDDGIVNVQDKDDAIDRDLQKNENRIVGKQPGHARYQIQDDDDNDDNKDSVQNKRREQFVENPEVVRERWEQQRAAWQQRHRPNNQPEQPQPQQHEVVGNARGRGQTATVTNNRRWKDTHKSSQANHNRRNRAAQKSNRGLLS